MKRKRITFDPNFCFTDTYPKRIDSFIPQISPFCFKISDIYHNISLLLKKDEHRDKWVQISKKVMHEKRKSILLFFFFINKSKHKKNIRLYYFFFRRWKLMFNKKRITRRIWNLIYLKLKFLQLKRVKSPIIFIDKYLRLFYFNRWKRKATTHRFKRKIHQLKWEKLCVKFLIKSRKLNTIEIARSYFSKKRWKSAYFSLMISKRCKELKIDEMKSDFISNKMLSKCNENRVIQFLSNRQRLMKKWIVFSYGIKSLNLLKCAEGVYFLNKFRFFISETLLNNKIHILKKEQSYYYIRKMKEICFFKWYKQYLANSITKNDIMESSFDAYKLSYLSQSALLIQKCFRSQQYRLLNLYQKLQLKQKWFDLVKKRKLQDLFRNKTKYQFYSFIDKVIDIKRVLIFMKMQNELKLFKQWHFRFFIRFLHKSILTDSLSKIKLYRKEKVKYKIDNKLQTKQPFESPIYPPSSDNDNEITYFRRKNIRNIPNSVANKNNSLKTKKVPQTFNNNRKSYSNNNKCINDYTPQKAGKGKSFKRYIPKPNFGFEETDYNEYDDSEEYDFKVNYKHPVQTNGAKKTPTKNQSHDKLNKSNKEKNNFFKSKVITPPKNGEKNPKKKEKTPNPSNVFILHSPNYYPRCYPQTDRMIKSHFFNNSIRICSMCNSNIIPSPNFQTPQKACHYQTISEDHYNNSCTDFDSEYSGINETTNCYTPYFDMTRNVIENEKNFSFERISKISNPIKRKQALSAMPFIPLIKKLKNCFDIFRLYELSWIEVEIPYIEYSIHFNADNHFNETFINFRNYQHHAEIKYQEVKKLNVRISNNLPDEVFDVNLVKLDEISKVVIPKQMLNEKEKIPLNFNFKITVVDQKKRIIPMEHYSQTESISNERRIRRFNFTKKFILFFGFLSNNFEDVHNNIGVYKQSGDISDEYVIEETEFIDHDFIDSDFIEIDFEIESLPKLFIFESRNDIFEDMIPENIISVIHKEISQTKFTFLFSNEWKTRNKMIKFFKQKYVPSKFRHAYRLFSINLFNLDFYLFLYLFLHEKINSKSIEFTKLKGIHKNKKKKQSNPAIINFTIDEDINFESFSVDFPIIHICGNSPKKDFQAKKNCPFIENCLDLEYIFNSFGVKDSFENIDIFSNFKLLNYITDSKNIQCTKKSNLLKEQPLAWIDHSVSVLLKKEITNCIQSTITLPSFVPQIDLNNKPVKQNINLKNFEIFFDSDVES